MGEDGSVPGLLELPRLQEHQGLQEGGGRPHRRGGGGDHRRAV
ncbi:hypothetical protein P2318_21115 [Myxococcaceae bacterium GXIMD 01537]